MTIAYALSPVDLIPDFIPVVGMLDDVVLIPALVWIIVHLAPRDVMLKSEANARRALQEKQKLKKQWLGAALVATVWCLVAYWIAVKMQWL